MSDWDGIERREYMKTIHDVESAFNRALEEHEVREKKNFDEGIEKLKKDAFPDGAENHKNAHQAMINAAQAQERFWNELKLDIAKKGTFGLLITPLGLLMLGIAVKFGLPRPIP